MTKPPERIGLALLLALVAARAPAAVDPAPPATGGGWTRDGWSDVAPGAVASPAAEIGARPVAPAPSADVASEWRRPAWDGGRGEAFRYQRGQHLPDVFTGPAYRVADWAGYGLLSPPAHARWVRYFDDAVLIDDEGRVIDATTGIGWTQPPAPYGRTARTAEAGAPVAPPVEAGAGATSSAATNPGTQIGNIPGGGKIVITTVTTPETSTTTVEEHTDP